MARLVDAQITEVSSDGAQAKVNIGVFDDVHVGQRLYVIRNDQLVGMLIVRQPDVYSSDCGVIEPREGSRFPDNAAVRIGKVRIGDLVVRKLSSVTRARAGMGLPLDKVPRMVPVPYEPDNATGSALETVIPRDQVEQWKKEHPLLQTGTP